MDSFSNSSSWEKIWSILMTFLKELNFEIELRLTKYVKCHYYIWFFSKSIDLKQIIYLWKHLKQQLYVWVSIHICISPQICQVYQIK